jgi:hypothetical protein
MSVSDRFCFSRQDGAWADTLEQFSKVNWANALCY